ncbi:hypothetical protein PIROE2DRAFT_13061, partial [Piromyces sp. E2]
DVRGNYLHGYIPLFPKLSKCNFETNSLTKDSLCSLKSTKCKSNTNYCSTEDIQNTHKENGNPNPNSDEYINEVFIKGEDKKEEQHIDDDNTSYERVLLSLMPNNSSSVPYPLPVPIIPQDPNSVNYAVPPPPPVTSQDPNSVNYAVPPPPPVISQDPNGMNYVVLPGSGTPYPNDVNYTMPSSAPVVSNPNPNPNPNFMYYQPQPPVAIMAYPQPNVQISSDCNPQGYSPYIYQDQQLPSNSMIPSAPQYLSLAEPPSNESSVKNKEVNNIPEKEEKKI